MNPTIIPTVIQATSKVRLPDGRIVWETETELRAGHEVRFRYEYRTRWLKILIPKFRFPLDFWGRIKGVEYV